MKLKPILCLAFVLGDHCLAAIVYPQAPNGGQQIVFKTAGEILGAMPRYLGGFRLEELTLGNPYRNYSFGEFDLATGHLLSAVRPGLWAYPFIHGTNVVGAAGLTADEQTGKALECLSLSQDVCSKEMMVVALQAAEQLPQIQKTD